MPRVDFRRLSVLFQILLLPSSICLAILVFCGLSPSFLQALSHTSVIIAVCLSKIKTASSLCRSLRRSRPTLPAFLGCNAK